MKLPVLSQVYNQTFHWPRPIHCEINVGELWWGCESEAAVMRKRLEMCFCFFLSWRAVLESWNIPETRMSSFEMQRDLVVISRDGTLIDIKFQTFMHLNLNLLFLERLFFLHSFHLLYFRWMFGLSSVGRFLIFWFDRRNRFGPVSAFGI